jgi:hypothetical protein
MPNTIRPKLLRAPLSIMCTAVLGVGFLQIAKSDESDKKTIVTINAPVEIPGRVLSPGTYVFKVLDSTGNRDVVQIFDKDKQHLIATVLAIPDYRLKPPDKPLIQFEERASDSPEAIKAWFYPGDQYGYEFVYPHTRAVELAKRTKHNVLSMQDNMTQNMKTQATSATNQDVQSLEKTEVTGVNPAGDQVELDVVILAKPKE